MVRLSQLDEIVYCINCIDEGSRKRGTFAYDEELDSEGFGTWAISPVFPTVDAFYRWARVEGFIYHHPLKNFSISRVFPVKQ